jgi:hypothetical protein
MVSSCKVIGNTVSCRGIAEALQKAFPGSSVRVGESGSEKSIRRNEMLVVDLGEDSDPSLIEGDEIKRLQAELRKAKESLAQMEKLHHNLVSKTESLQRKNEIQSSNLAAAIWTHCAPHHPGMVRIPMMEDPQSFVETDIRVGPYKLGSG